MKTTTKIIFALALLALLTFNNQISTAFAQNDAFSYQGRLNVNGVPANGTYDFNFSLWDDPIFGNLWTSTTNTAVAVSNGLFTTAVNLGSFAQTAFDTTYDFWLRISVRTNGGGLFTSLSPTQPLLAMPRAIAAKYAAFASTASTASNILSSADLQATRLNIGTGNILSGTNATIAGGSSNTATNYDTTIGGGSGNVAGNIWDTVAGGGNNQATGGFSSIGGGHLNQATANYSYVGGGQNNVAAGSDSAIAGGANNAASGPLSAIVGGRYNVANGSGAFIGGGEGDTSSGFPIGNIASGASSVIGGGFVNFATTNYATVGGGIHNQATNNSATVPGGAQMWPAANTASRRGARPALSTMGLSYGRMPPAQRFALPVRINF